MPVRGESVEQGAARLRRRWLWWLIGGRVLVAALLLGVGALWSGSAEAGRAGSGRLGATLGLALAVLALSVVYALALRFAPLRFEVQAGAQLFLDVLLITWLVCVTGDIFSPYSALYIVVISVAGVFLGSRGALSTAVGCATSYTAATFALALGWLDGAGVAGRTTTLPQVAEAVGMSDAAFLAVGLLAARLAERQTRSEAERREATHALASLRALHERIVESIRSGVITTDLERRVYTINAAAVEMTGYTPDDLRGKDVSVLLGDIRQQIETSLRAAAEGQTSPRFEADCLTAEGFRVRLGYSVSPLFAEGGKTTGLVITFQDLTDIRAMEETSRRQERLSAVGRVAAGIAHEIRNPLAAMRGSIQVLRSESADPSQAELMDIVLRESDRLNRIITDFLTYARPRPVSLRETDLREPLRETFALLRHSPEAASGHRLEDVTPPEPLHAPADVEAIRQVFWNLARNALKAMPEGGALRAAMEPVGDHAVRITFTDTGRGMSPAQVERLFEPFSSSTTGGTGLGLSIVYQIVKDHGGSINVRSREGHGTTITIELPSAASTRARPAAAGEARDLTR